MPEGGLIGGRYRVVRELGAGTYGCVYEAIAPDGLRVAIKVIRERLLAKDAERVRFQREGETLRRLQHPHIVRVLDTGFEAEQPFIVFELLSGRSLSAELRRVRFMSAGRVAGIMRQVLEAVAHAHQQGVIHRDIKPANIHLCHSRTDVDHVSVLDFGVAKSFEAGELERLTQSGAIVGTPGYMAPEQIRGEALTPTADVFALGMSMARLLSGERFFGDTLFEVVRMHIEHGPIPMPRSVLVSELGQVVERAVRKNPWERFQGAAEMLGAMNAAMQDAAPTSVSGTVLMPEHLEGEASPSSTIPIGDMPWLDVDRD